ncbi:MAG: transporter substrate-binding domain-containing protein [Pseudomonadota bacterium]
MKSFFGAVLGAALLLSATPLRAEQGPDDPPTPLPAGPRSLVVGVASDTPPFSGTSRFGVRVGFDVDVALAVCTRMNARCRLLPLPADEMASSLRERRVDLLVASDGRIGELGDTVGLSNPYVSLAARYLVRRGKTVDFQSGETRFGAIVDTPYARFLTEAHTPAAVTLYDRADEMWIDLSLDRLDTVLSTAVSARNEFLATALGEEFQINPRPVEDPAVAARDASIVVRQTEASLLAGIDEALAELLASAEYDEILTRHLAGGLAHKPIPPRGIDAERGT